MIDKEIVKKNFSRYAQYYDSHSAIQNLCASRLISKIDNNSFFNILDIGCGTGYYTRLLREKFPKARILAIDVSGEMIGIAKERLEDAAIEFITGDAETMYFREKFDLISSNASFQWFSNLKETIAKYKESLDIGGGILFSTFGPLTFHELDLSLRELSQGHIEIAASNFLGKEEVEEILKSLFSKIEIEQEIYRESYDSLSELLRKIKYSGTRGGLTDKKFWTQKTIEDLEKVYKRKFRKVIATYQVFFCKGVN